MVRHHFVGKYDGQDRGIFHEKPPVPVCGTKSTRYTGILSLGFLRFACWRPPVYLCLIMFGVRSGKEQQWPRASFHTVFCPSPIVDHRCTCLWPHLYLYWATCEKKQPSETNHGCSASALCTEETFSAFRKREESIWSIHGGFPTVFVVVPGNGPQTGTNVARNRYRDGFKWVKRKT